MKLPTLVLLLSLLIASSYQTEFLDKFVEYQGYVAGFSQASVTGVLQFWKVETCFSRMWQVGDSLVVLASLQSYERGWSDNYI